MNFKTSLKSAALCAVAFAAICCSSPSKEDMAGKALEEIAKKNNTVGLAVVAVNDGEIVYKNY